MVANDNAAVARCVGLTNSECLTLKDSSRNRKHRHQASTGDIPRLLDQVLGYIDL